MDRPIQVSISSRKLQTLRDDGPRTSKAMDATQASMYTVGLHFCFHLWITVTCDIVGQRKENTSFIVHNRLLYVYVHRSEYVMLCQTIDVQLK